MGLSFAAEEKIDLKAGAGWKTVKIVVDLFTKIAEIHTNLRQQQQSSPFLCDLRLHGREDASLVTTPILPPLSLSVFEVMTIMTPSKVT